MKITRPKALKAGATVGIFTPSYPAHTNYFEKYQHGIKVLEGMGFKVVEGSLTKVGGNQGYRSGTPQARAAELMELILDPKIDALISTIGGTNSSSLIPYLDFDAIRAHPKVICGYSDVTSLHLAILAYSGLSTFYGPAVMPSFGEWPDILPETKSSFLEAVQFHREGIRPLTPPAQWSHKIRNALNREWKNKPREYEKNLGWKVLNKGTAESPVIVANLNTLMSSAGTTYFPKLEGKILLIEQMNVSLANEERHLRHLERLGVFDVITGLIVGKPEVYNQENAPFGHDDLIMEIVGANRSYPIVSGFDCSHTNPMLTIAEMTPISVQAASGYDVHINVLEPMVL